MCQQRGEDVVTKAFIEWLPTDCDISNESLAECLTRLPPARIYTLYCGQRAFDGMRSWLRRSEGLSNPFLPQINVVVEPMAKPFEWVVEAGGKRVGSHGISW